MGIDMKRASNPEKGSPIAEPFRVLIFLICVPRVLAALEPWAEISVRGVFFKVNQGFYSTNPLPSLTVTTLFTGRLVKVSTAPLGQRT
jgi:hypothetical protein